MADPWTKAFGLYLRTLRERRELSLQDVATLSQSFADTVNKGYLSRCENGLQRLGFSKVIPLSRIYEVPADVLLERMELDMEVDRIGAPDTEGKTFSELTAASSATLGEGYKWKAYGFVRDAIKRAHIDPPSDRYRDMFEQVANSHMNCAIMAQYLGRSKYALHEFQHVLSTGWLGPRYLAVLYQQFSTTFTALNDADRARQYADAAVSEAESHRIRDVLGLVYGTRAELAMQADPEFAANLYKKAFAVFRQDGSKGACAITLNNLGQCFLNMKRYQAARRAVLAGERLCRATNRKRSLAISNLLLGVLDEIENKDDHALKHWKHAIEVARELDDKELRFKGEFLLFRHVLSRGDLPVARAVQRRLTRLAPWVPPEMEEVHDFKQLVAALPTKRLKRNAGETGGLKKTS